MYSSCLHDQQDLCWGNTSRDKSEESQESQEIFNILEYFNGTTCLTICYITLIDKNG